MDRCESRTTAEAINRGMQLATGDVIGWLPSDDYYEAGAFARVDEFFNSHPEIDVVYGGVREVDEWGDLYKLAKAPPWSPSKLERRCLITVPSCFCRRSVWEQHGTPDPNLAYWYDYGYWLRLSLAGVKFAPLNAVLGNRRHRPEALRYGSICERRVLQATEEMCSIQEQLTGSVSVKTALVYGNRRMRAERVDRDTTLDYDRGVMTAAYRRLNNTKRFSKTRIFFKHCAVEAVQLLKRPRYLVRFLPGPLNRLARNHLRHRVFADLYSAPRPVSIPETYFEAIELEHPPKISIVTPNLNQGKFIEATIQSILNQNYPNLEFIIQDGVSTDESLDVIKRYESSLTRWDSSPDDGQAHAINKGMRHTSGEIMAFLNSDDFLLPGSLEYVAGYFQKHPEVDVVYGHRILVNEEGDEISRWVLPPHDDATIPYADYIPQETMFWRRRAWEAIGAHLDESFQFALDWDLILRFREAGMRFERLPRFLGAFRISDTHKTSALIRTVGEREMRKLRQRVFGRNPSRREIRRQVKPYLRRQWFYDLCYKLGFAQY
jgi:glycosyltransferase involved in cell wall biosynthesis